MSTKLAASQSRNSRSETGKSWFDQSFGKAARIAAATATLGASEVNSLGGYTDPLQPPERYTESGRRCIGPYRPKVDGSPGFDGGLVSVTMTQRDPATGAQVKRLIASGIILNNYYILTSAHGAIFAKQNPTTVTTTIDWSTNCLVTNPSAIQAFEVAVYPGWTNENKYSVPDIAILKLKRPIVEGGMEVEPTFAIKKPSNGAVLTIAGYGVSGYSQATQFDDGQPRAGNGITKTSSSDLLGYSTESYFSISSSAVNLEATPVMVGANGDSGGLVMERSTGAIAGMMVASTKTLPGRTIALDLSAPLVQSFIKATVKPVIPTDLSLQVKDGSTTFTWPSGYSGLVVQKSTDLTTWEDLPLPRIIEGNSEKMIIPQGSGPRGFFRLKYRP
jgi:hypothetical protein